MSRPRSVLLQEQRRTPRRRQRHLRHRPVPGPRRPLQGARLAPPGGLGPAPPRRRRARARLLHSCPRRVSGAELGEGARRLVPGRGMGAWGGGGARAAAGLWRSPSGGLRGRGARPPAQEAQRRRRHPVGVARGPAALAPGSPAPARSGEQCPACGLRASLGPSRPPSARRPAWAAGPGETKGPRWRPRPQPLLAARPPPPSPVSCRLGRGAGQGRGSARGRPGLRSCCSA